jgi:hypothetical protein
VSGKTLLLCKFGHVLLNSRFIKVGEGKLSKFMPLAVFCRTHSEFIIPSHYKKSSWQKVFVFSRTNALETSHWPLRHDNWLKKILDGIPFIKVDLP